MTTPSKNPINNFAPVFLMLMATFLLGFGCNTSKPKTDPLAGFHFSDLINFQNNKAISDDYKNYIQALSPEERRNVSPIEFSEDGAGQHAIEIIVGVNGRSWRHILIYDKDNKRIKTIKYATGYYAS